MKGKASHQIVADGLQILENLTHRGAVGADPLMGDGAGMLVQIPHAFFAEEAKGLGIDLPESGRYGVGFIFLPQDPELRKTCEEIIERVIAAEGQERASAGATCRSTIPRCPRRRRSPRPNLLIARSSSPVATARRRTISSAACSSAQGDLQHRARGNRRRRHGFYIVSLSSRTIVYKGMFLAYQLGAYYADLKDERAFTSALALVHQRFSTNTFPSWELAHPYRMVAHNGEINTLRGNVNWMAAARRASLAAFGDDISKLWPISYEGQSDTACFDNALEFLSPWAAIRSPMR
jgi:glutamate synthase (NADPH/NADH) large chain